MDDSAAVGLLDKALVSIGVGTGTVVVVDDDAKTDDGHGRAVEDVAAPAVGGGV